MLNTQAHAEQPQPQKFWSSTHTSLRRIASMGHLPNLVWLFFREKSRRSIGFQVRCDDKSYFFNGLRRSSAQATPL